VVDFDGTLLFWVDEEEVGGCVDCVYEEAPEYRAFPG